MRKPCSSADSWSQRAAKPWASFSLVESAVQLAARGASVAVWDLDLEAPGLQKIPALARQLEPALQTGTLDLLWTFQKNEFKSFATDGIAKALLAFELPDAMREAGGRLDFLLPGKLGSDYGEAFRRIGWRRLFAPGKEAGPAFFLHVVQHLLDDLGYEYVMIDSRTGFTDLGAVSTLLLPDVVVIVFNLNEQNLAGIEQTYKAVTALRHTYLGEVPVFLLANMVPDKPASLKAEKLAKLADKGLKPHHVLRHRPELLLTEELPSLAGSAEAVADWEPVVDAIEGYRRRLVAKLKADRRERVERARGPEELDELRRRGILERAKTFEEEVAELFRLLGYKTVVDYKKDDMQFDVRLEMAGGPLPAWVLVECKDTAAKVGQRDVREFASKVEHLRRSERRNYQAILVARSGFVNNAHAVAAEQFVELRTYDELLLSLVDLGPHLDAAVNTYRGTALERLYVEQDVVLQSELEPGEEVRARPIFEAVHEWLERRDAPFLALLGDFGSGKTSFCRRLACELALAARGPSDEPRRRPVLVDLREGGSATVTLENLLTHCFQRLSSRPLQPQALLRLSHEGHLVLLFDGFDEIVGYAEPGRFVEHLRQILRAASGKAKVVLTCRTHYFRDRPEEVRRLGKARDVISSEGATRLFDELTKRPGTEIAYLREFTPGQIDDYLEKALPPPADWRSFRDEIRRTYNLEDLAERPFLLEIIVKTLPRLRDRGQVTLADLYETYCESWFAHTDFRLTLTREHKVALVEYLARLIWDAPGQSVHYEELFEKSTEFFADKSLTPHDKERIDYEVRTALFLHRDERGYYRFIHRSFLEFFLARTLRAGLESQDPDCLDLKRLTREVVLFLTFWPEAERIPELAGQVLEEGYRPRVSENALVLLDLWVRSGIAPLVGPGSEALDEADVLGKVRERWMEARPRGIVLAGAELDGVDLRGADLSGARLKGARLESADLRGARLDGARLGGASLALADLREASLAEVDAKKAVLHHADLRGASLQHADFTAADLDFARLVRADLKGAVLRDARILGTAFLDGERPRRPRHVVQRGHGSRVGSVALSPDGHFVVSGSEDGTVLIWDGVSGAPLRILAGHASGVLSVAWDASGERLASGSSDQTVKLWEAASGKLLRTLHGHANRVLSVAWDPSGERLASGSDDQTVKLWEAASGKLLRTLEGHEGLVRSVAWTPDGRRLAVATTGGWIDIWYVPARGQPRRLGRLVELAGGLGFALTADGYVDGPPAALEHLRFVDGWAVYDVDDLPERVSPERVAAAYGKR